MVPGGLERMIFELAELPPNSITDAAVWSAIAARYDSFRSSPHYRRTSQRRRQPGPCH
jgi:hypothetical protein